MTAYRELIERPSVLLHDWVPYPYISETARVCQRCGIMRRRDGGSDAKECRGKVKVALRALEAQSKDKEEGEA